MRMTLKTAVTTPRPQNRVTTWHAMVYGSTMRQLETPMTRRYWERIRGTLLEEYPVGQRRIDAVIIEGGLSDAAIIVVLEDTVEGLDEGLSAA